MTETNGDETAPVTSLQSTTGPQTTNGSENVDSGNTQDVNQPLHNPPPTADTGLSASPSTENSGTNLQLSSNSNVSMNYANPMATQPRAKLPKQVLPKIKGDVTQWKGFWDSYNSSIHTNPQLTQIDKFNHLHSLLEGQAARSIQGLTRTEGNYNSAIDLLYKRVGKPQDIISKHLDEMLKIPECVNNNASQL